MIAGLRPYPAYRDSGVEWLDDLPAHWSVHRLRDLCELRVSNVDKHSRPDEQPVRLCNYIDVYKNDHIQSEMPFMRATATAEEIERFRLQVGDVLVTKDSEAWNDIGVPAVVREADADVICGYHLALLRPDAEAVQGNLLFRSLQSHPIAHQFHVAANGITRYGLSHSALKSVRLPVPPVSEQAAIARFLDHADQRIQQAITAKEKRIALLEEQKRAILHRAVTGQIDVRTEKPYPAYKDSGVDWLGEIPEHWSAPAAKRSFRESDDRSTTGTEELMSVSHVTGVTPRSEKNVTMFRAESHVGHKLCREGDIVVNTMWAWMAALGLARQTGIVSPSYAVYRPRPSSRFVGDYVELLLRTTPYKGEIRRRSTGIRPSRLRLYPDEFLRLPLLCPTPEEQNAIVRFQKERSTIIGRYVQKSNDAIAHMKEYRTRLIADVVTGKLDVRETATALPDTAPA